jgi:hypothetical protein
VVVGLSAGASLLGLSLTGIAADAPAKIAVMDGTADGRRLQPYGNAWIYSATKPGGQSAVQGIWTDHFSAVTVDGKAAWRRLQGMTYVNHVMSSVSNSFDAITCAPISNEQYHPDGSILKRKFSGRHVTTERIANAGAGPVKTEIDLPQPVFDFYGGTYGLLLSCLPLKVGYSGVLPAIAETEDKLAATTFSVVRAERVSAGSRGTRDTLVVVVDTPDSYTQTFWLSKEPPYVIRLEVKWADAHAVATFEML